MDFSNITVNPEANFIGLHLTLETAAFVKLCGEARAAGKAATDIVVVLDGVNYELTFAQFSDAIRRAAAPQGVQAEPPAGFALVPKEPTREMYQAFWAQYLEVDWLTKGYRVMLAAAPAAPAQEPQQPAHEGIPYVATLAADMAKATAQEVALRYAAPSVLYRPELTKDGNAWCALYGANIMEGVCGFGDTPQAAMDAFDRAWTGQPAQGGGA